jgi:hypothetical protein
MKTKTTVLNTKVVVVIHYDSGLIIEYSLTETIDEVFSRIFSQYGSIQKAYDENHYYIPIKSNNEFPTQVIILECSLKELLEKLTIHPSQI